MSSVVHSAVRQVPGLIICDVIFREH